MPMGVSYQPGADIPFDQGTGGSRVRGVAPQEAVRLLNLRIPQSRTAGAGGLAPLPLLNAAGGGGSDLDMLLKALMAAFGGGGGGRGGAQATPRVVPGINDPSGGGAVLQGPGPYPQIPPDTPLDSTGRTIGNGGFAGGLLAKGQPQLQGPPTPQFPTGPSPNYFGGKGSNFIEPLF